MMSFRMTKFLTILILFFTFDIGNSFEQAEINAAPRARYSLARILRIKPEADMKIVYRNLRTIRNSIDRAKCLWKTDITMKNGPLQLAFVKGRDAVNKSLILSKFDHKYQYKDGYLIYMTTNGIPKVDMGDGKGLQELRVSVKDIVRHSTRKIF